ncbi:MAG: response regulator [Deltaproteobacteria bacterium]|nr:response regulator [Deltaproteobacteria bacterium]MBW2619752.1 response regulator [Deltaproteobacteria bacterium]
MITPKVMLVDDEAPFVETMTKRLAKRNLKVLTSFSGEEALEMLDINRDTDVVILDVKMPGMNGTETLEKIRKQFPLIEVIMLTGHGTVEAAIEGMRLGAFDFLMKPCEIEQLMAKVQEATQKRRNHEEKIREAKVMEVLATRSLE